MKRPNDFFNETQNFPSLNLVETKSSDKKSFQDISIW